MLPLLWSVTALDIFQNGVTSIRWQEWFLKGNQSDNKCDWSDTQLSCTLLLELYQQIYPQLPPLSRTQTQTHTHTDTHNHTHAKTHATWYTLAALCFCPVNNLLLLPFLENQSKHYKITAGLLTLILLLITMLADFPRYILTLTSIILEISG